MFTNQHQTKTAFDIKPFHALVGHVCICNLCMCTSALLYFVICELYLPFFIFVYIHSMHVRNWPLLLWLYQVNILLGFECFVHILRSGVADYVIFLEQ
jgi:hypothetical protein